MHREIIRYVCAVPFAAAFRSVGKEGMVVWLIAVVAGTLRFLGYRNALLLQRLPRGQHPPDWDCEQRVFMPTMPPVRRRSSSLDSSGLPLWVRLGCDLV